VSFQFKSAAAVAVGTFNIYIVQPHWLAEIGLLKEHSQLRMEADFNRPGFRFRVDGAQIRWNVRPDRLMLETQSADEDCGEPLATVLKVLEWTPLLGVGTNLEFEAEPAILSRLSCPLPKCEAPDGFEVGQRTWHISVIRGPHQFNFQLALQAADDPAAAPAVGLSINVHTDTSKENGHQRSSALGQSACKLFRPHCDEALALASDFLGVEISR